MKPMGVINPRPPVVPSFRWDDRGPGAILRQAQSYRSSSVHLRVDGFGLISYSHVDIPSGRYSSSKHGRPFETFRTGGSGGPFLCLRDPKPKKEGVWNERKGTLRDRSMRVGTQGLFGFWHVKAIKSMAGSSNARGIEAPNK